MRKNVKKLALLPLIFFFLIPSVFAYQVLDQIFSLERIEDDICQDGEFPLLNSECNLKASDWNNLKFMEYGWFYKVLSALLIWFLYKNPSLFKDRNFLILILFIAFLLIAFPLLRSETNLNKSIEQNLTESSPPETFVNESSPPELIIKSSIDTTFDTFKDKFNEFTGEHKFLGAVLLFLVLASIVAIWNVLLDWFDSFRGRK